MEDKEVEKLLGDLAKAYDILRLVCDQAMKELIAGASDPGDKDEVK